MPASLKDILMGRAQMKDPALKQQVENPENWLMGEVDPPGIKFPAKIPELPKGFKLMDDLWGQIEKIRKGYSFEDYDKLAEVLPEINSLPSMPQNAPSPGSFLINRTFRKETPAAFKEAIDKGPHRLAQYDNATLEQIMRFLAD